MIKSGTKPQESGRKNPAKAARLVWLIVLLGLGSGVVTLCAVRAALSNIREQRTRLAKLHEAVDQLDNEMGRGFAEAHGEIQQLLTLQADWLASGQWLGRMTRSLDTFNLATNNADVAKAINRMRAFLTDLN